MANKAEKVIAATMGWDESEVDYYRYQAGHTPRPYYSISDKLYCIGAKPPRDGGQWTLNPDQFWAEEYGTKLWVWDQGETP